MTVLSGGPAPAASEDTSEELAVGGAVAIKGRTPSEILRARLRRDRVTLVAAFFSVFFLVVAVVSPLLVNLGVLDPFTTHGDLVKSLGSLPDGPLGGVSADHWLGVEPGTGRDLLSRMMTGITTSLTVAVLATIFSVVFGVILGIVAGYAKGRTDWVISRFLDLVLSFPQTLMLLSLAPILTERLANLLGLEPSDNKAKIAFMVVVLGFFAVPFVARIIRGQVFSLREREFIEAAQSLGARTGRIYFKELLPHVWAPILVYSTLIMPQNIANEAALGFLGVGITPPAASLGSILNDAVSYAPTDPAYFIFPGLIVFFMVLAFNLVGDGLRDALDPKAGRR